MFLCNGKESQQFQIPYLKLKAVRKISELKIFFCPRLQDKIKYGDIGLYFEWKRECGEFFKLFFFISTSVFKEGGVLKMRWP